MSATKANATGHSDMILWVYLFIYGKLNDGLLVEGKNPQLYPVMMMLLALEEKNKIHFLVTICRVSRKLFPVCVATVEELLIQLSQFLRRSTGQA